LILASRSNGDSVVGAMITKDFRTYTTNILRRKKSFRDHGRVLVNSIYSGVTRAR
jgi:hypothetical protein